MAAMESTPSKDAGVETDRQIFTYEVLSETGVTLSLGGRDCRLSPSAKIYFGGKCVVKDGDDTIEIFGVSQDELNRFVEAGVLRKKTGESDRIIREILDEQPGQRGGIGRKTQVAIAAVLAAIGVGAGVTFVKSGNNQNDQESPEGKPVPVAMPGPESSDEWPVVEDEPDGAGPDPDPEDAELANTTAPVTSADSGTPVAPVVQEGSVEPVVSEEVVNTARFRHVTYDGVEGFVSVTNNGGVVCAIVDIRGGHYTFEIPQELLERFGGSDEVNAVLAIIIFHDPESWVYDKDYLARVLRGFGIGVRSGRLVFTRQ